MIFPNKISDLRLIPLHKIIVFKFFKIFTQLIVSNLQRISWLEIKNFKNIQIVLYLYSLWQIIKFLVT